MSLRPPSGFIRPGYDPLKVPNAPTIGTATGGDASASVAFTAPSNVGGSAISAYYAVSNPDQITGTGASSPVSVTGLTNGTSYTFSVWALNSYGPGPYSGASGSVTPVAIRGLFGGGYTSSGEINTIDYVSISSAGNATDFGDLTLARYAEGACASSTRGIWLAGFNTPAGELNVIDYVTIASAGNATDFGDTTTKVRGNAGCNSNTRGVSGGSNVNSAGNVIAYITMASAGNATDFGDLTVARGFLAACSSPTRGIFAGGDSGTYPTFTFQNVIDYITIASAGNATDFGDLSSGRRWPAGASSSTRGLFFGGATDNSTFAPINAIVYITIASTGNSTSFGDLTVAVRAAAACSSTTRALCGGGQGVNKENTISYVTIDSTGNAADFGDLTVASDNLAACSNGNGGVQ